MRRPDHPASEIFSPDITGVPVQFPFNRFSDELIPDHLSRIKQFRLPWHLDYYFLRSVPLFDLSLPTIPVKLLRGKEEQGHG